MKTDIAPNLPQSVFYFCASLEYSFDAFLNKYLYLRHPHQFNDLMDTSQYTLDIRNSTKEQFDDLKEDVVNNALQINKHANVEINGLENSIFKSFFSHSGIICMSAGARSRFHELMWSHYAKEAGFMIEFDTQKLIDGIKECSKNTSIKELFFKPVEYKNHPTSIRCCDFLNIRDINILNTYQKYEGWNYENEHRIVAVSNEYLGEYSYYLDKQDQAEGKRNLYYPAEAIKRIYIGKRFWTKENHIKEDREDNPNRRIYTINDFKGEEKNCESKKKKEKTRQVVRFIEELRNYEVYMSGACDCSEYRHGTDSCVCNTKTRQCEFNANSYYLTRSFERIKSIEIKGQTITVTYDGIARTKDEDFE